MFPRFEVRVGEAEEKPGERAAGEEIGEEFHGVGAEAGDVLVWGLRGEWLGFGLWWGKGY